MQPAPEEYTRHYIVQALFRLMAEYEYDKISVKDIAAKAGVGRATFYRHFKRKEDVILYYFERSAREYVSTRHIYPRCREDYVDEVTRILGVFRDNKKQFALLERARLTYIYLDFLNDTFARSFEEERPEKNAYLPYMYAGMLYNLSMKWLENDCAESIPELAAVIVDAIYRV